MKGDNFRGLIMRLNEKKKQKQKQNKTKQNKTLKNKTKQNSGGTDLLMREETS